MYHLDQRDVREYWARMSTLPQFRMYDAAPQWVPGSRNVETFCHDEVVRQYHDPHTLAGKSRIQMMVAAWEWAKSAANDHGLPDMRDIVALGKLVEPEQNSTIGFRTHGIQITNSRGETIHGASPLKLKEFMMALLTQVDVEPLAKRGTGAHPDEYRMMWGHFETMVKSISTADDWYLAYEAVHPWDDGNGRTGKVLHNWLLGSLNEPVLVANYFGGNIA